MAQAWFGFLNAWEDFHVLADGYHELDIARVLVPIHRSGHGRKSGLDVEEMGSRAADLFQLDAGKVVRLVHYWAREHALADLGLAPEADTADSSSPSGLNDS